MQCYNDGCTTELTGRQRQYCSDRCQKATERQRKAVEDGSGSTNADTDIPLNADKCLTSTNADKVYGRPAVHYDHDDFDTRPEPLNITDTPLPLNRGRYTREDGTQYQFDAIGQAFKVVNGQVYQTLEDVRLCYA